MDELEIKKITKKKYDLLMKKEREQLTMQQLQKIKKQEEMRRLHEMI